LLRFFFVTAIVLGLCPHFDQLHEIFGDRALPDTREYSEDEENNSFAPVYNEPDQDQCEDSLTVLCKPEMNHSDADSVASSPSQMKIAVKKHLNKFKRAAKRQMNEGPDDEEPEESKPNIKNVMNSRSYV